MCPSVSVIGLSIVRLSVCHFSVPSVCDVLPISVIGLSISVLLSNRPSVCPSLCFCPTVLQSVQLTVSRTCPQTVVLNQAMRQKFLRLLLWLWVCDLLLIQLHHVLCRLLLWDCDDRSYSFYVEVSTDQQKWHRVADKSSEACK